MTKIALPAPIQKTVRILNMSVIDLSYTHTYGNPLPRVKFFDGSSHELTSELIDGIVSTLEEARSTVAIAEMIKLQDSIDKQKRSVQYEKEILERKEREFESLLGKFGLYIPAADGGQHD